MNKGIIMGNKITAVAFLLLTGVFVSATMYGGAIIFFGFFLIFLKIAD